MNKYALSFLFIFPLLCSSCSNLGINGLFVTSTSKSHNSNPPKKDETLNFTHFSPEMKNGNYKTRKTNSFLLDPCFRNGFNVYNTDSTNAHTVDVLTYQNNRDTTYTGTRGDKTYWSYAPWWAPEETTFLNSDTNYFNTQDEQYVYETKTRLLKINPSNGNLIMGLNANLENRMRFSTPTLPENQNWSHALIQQNFNKIYLKDFKEIHVVFDITINKMNYYGSSLFPTGMECAQILFYLVPYTPSCAMWYGIPIFDSRYPSLEFYAKYDSTPLQKQGAMIHNMPSNIYMGNAQPQIGKTYHVDVDILNIENYSIKSAFEYGVKHNFFNSYNYNEIILDYFNFGFEIPGAFDTEIRFENFDIYGISM